MKNENKLLLKTAAEDFFGLAVAIDNDLIVVGSPFDDDKGSESGSVYVFSKKIGGVDGWGQVLKLTASDGFAQGEFGRSVAIHKDKIIVGTWSSVNGKAYIYQILKCPQNMNFTANPISDNIYRAQQSISSSSQVPLNGLVDFRSNTIYLLHNFEVKQGAMFHALIEDCN